MSNNVTTNKPKTYSGYKVIGKNAIINKGQEAQLMAQFKRFKKALGFSDEDYETFVIDSINDVLEPHNGSITTYQVGADKTGSDSDLMIAFNKRIDELHSEFVSENKGQIFSIDGKFFWADKNNKLREFSRTFTARTPEGYTAKEYQAHLMKKAKALGLSLDNETKDVIKEEEKTEVNSEVINEI